MLLLPGHSDCLPESSRQSGVGEPSAQKSATCLAEISPFEDVVDEVHTLGIWKGDALGRKRRRRKSPEWCRNPHYPTTNVTKLSLAFFIPFFSFDWIFPIAFFITCLPVASSPESYIFAARQSSCNWSTDCFAKSVFGLLGSVLWQLSLKRSLLKARSVSRAEQLNCSDGSSTSQSVSILCEACQKLSSSCIAPAISERRDLTIWKVHTAQKQMRFPHHMGYTLHCEAVSQTLPTIETSLFSSHAGWHLHLIHEVLQNFAAEVHMETCLAKASDFPLCPAKAVRPSPHNWACSSTIPAELVTADQCRGCAV